MKRSRRRVWNWAVTIAASLAVLAALVTGLFRVAVEAAPGYRDDLQAYIGRLAGREVRIGRMDLTWSGLRPTLDLGAIEVVGEDGEAALAADGLKLGFGLWRLATGDFMPGSVELSGTDVSVRWIEGQGYVVAGLERLRRGSVGGGDPQAVLRELARFDRIVFEGCGLTLEDPRYGDTPLAWMLHRAELRRRSDRFSVQAAFELPPDVGDTLDLELEVDGPLEVPAQWRGHWEAHARDLVTGGWLDAFLAPGADLEVEGLELRASGDIESFPAIDATFELDAASLRGGVADAGSEWIGAHLEGRAHWGPDSRRLELDKVTLGSAAGPWPEATLDAVQHIAPDGSHTIELDAPYLRLEDLAPLLASFRAVPVELRALAGLSGEIRGLVLRVGRAADGTVQARYRADLAGVGLRNEHLAVAGISGELAGDEQGGRLSLQDAPLLLTLPQTFEAPVPFDRVAGEVEWQRLAEGWRAGMPQFSWQALGTTGIGSAALLLPRDAAPHLIMSAQFSSSDVTRLKPYVSKRWGVHTRRWLQESIMGGRVSAAELRLDAPLGGEPVNRIPGAFALDLSARGVDLAYGRGWPAATGVDAQVEFRDNGLSFVAERGTLGGVDVADVRGSIADYGESHLTIDGNARGDAATFYEFLDASPLQKRLAGLLDHTAASGPVTAQLHLELPLKNIKTSTARGDIALDGVELAVSELAEPVHDVRGRIHFDDESISGQDLSGTLYEAPVTARIEPADKGGWLVAGFDFAPRADGEGLSAYVPAFLRPQLSGRSRWNLRLRLGAPDALRLTLTSNLQGTAIDLPAPLGKSAEAIEPALVTLAAPAEDRLVVVFQQEQRIAAETLLARDGEAWRTRRVRLSLGGAPLPEAQDTGMYIGGDLAELDLPVWLGVLSGAGGEGAMEMKAAALRIARVRHGEWGTDGVDVALSPTARGWRAQLSGEGAQGTLDWRRAPDSALAVDLEHLRLEMGPTDPEPDSEQGDERDPAAMPTLDVAVRSLQLNGTNLGALKMSTVRIPDGQRLASLALAGGVIDLQADGQWWRRAPNSGGHLNFRIASSDVAAALAAAGYSPSISAQSAAFTGALQWPANSTGIRLRHAHGHIDVNARNGELQALEPGAGRVLGLINFYALPRRLTLNFRDVVGKGLAFDSVKGRFDLRDGQAITDDLVVDAPSLRMELRGRVGLAARDYDQKVTVYPDMSSGVTLGAALLGGPAAGVIALLAQEILDKPLDQASQLTYHLTGSWDNPVVKKADGG